MKLDNLTLGYNVPLKGKVISKMRIYVTGQNLLTLTKYKGMDPETPGATYPVSRSVMFSVNVGF